jgi:hypothetical protein
MAEQSEPSLTPQSIAEIETALTGVTVPDAQKLFEGVTSAREEYDPRMGLSLRILPRGIVLNIGLIGVDATRFDMFTELVDPQFGRLNVNESTLPDIPRQTTFQAGSIGLGEAPTGEPQGRSPYVIVGVLKAGALLAAKLEAEESYHALPYQLFRLVIHGVEFFNDTDSG